MRHGKSKNKYVPIPICDFGLGHALKNKWHACPGSYNKGRGRWEEEGVRMRQMGWIDGMDTSIDGMDRRDE